MTRSARSSMDHEPKTIANLSVRGFKCLRGKCEIDIAPLTVLAGANSSGKSSMIQPLLLLKQTMEATYDPGPLLINGPNVRFTEAEQLLSFRAGAPREDSFTVGFRSDPQSRSPVSLTFRKSPGAGFELGEACYGEGGEPIRADMPQEELRSRYQGRLRQFERALGLKPGQGAKIEVRVARERCFLVVQLLFARKRGPWAYLEAPHFLFHPIIGAIIHVPGLRGNPERTYNRMQIGPYFPGTFENYVASVIHNWQVTEDKDVKKLAKAIESLGLTWKVRASRADDAKLVVEVGRLPHAKRGGASDLVSIADVGIGVSQVLPVLVALLVAREGQIVFVEQPELHLHPRAQHLLAQVLADAANRGVRVIAETHSHLLILGIQSLIAERKLSPGLVKLHWFHRDPQTGETHVTPGDLDENGAFGNWPEDFSDVTLKAQDRYLSAGEARASGGAR